MASLCRGEETRKRPVVVASGSVKDLIEALGVPHAEVDLVLANGESMDFSCHVKDGNRISVLR